ncbi:MAG: hypothetical protein QM534_12095 [Sediminibacterium sp.]|nr:hypothetical protein [Sediminibacterium sp.]
MSRIGAKVEASGATAKLAKYKQAITENAVLAEAAGQKNGPR